jgi:hypothetical protein
VRASTPNNGSLRTNDSGHEALSGALGFVSGPVLAVTVHGLFEEPAYVAALLGAPPRRWLKHAIDELTVAVVTRVDATALDALAGLTPR